MKIAQKLRNYAFFFAYMQIFLYLCGLIHECVRAPSAWVRDRDAGNRDEKGDERGAEKGMKNGVKNGTKRG